MDTNTKIAVIGLGYVGLPLAVHFSAKFHTIGLDLKEKIIENCKKHQDPTGEVSKEEFEKASFFFPTSDPSKVSDADYIIVAVPTPIDKARRPDLKYMVSSSITAGKYMKQGAIVIFESTVYPGVTEDVCVPILERESGYKWKKDFHVGYSPERINPGDKEHTLPKIIKVGGAKQVFKNILVLQKDLVKLQKEQAKLLADFGKVIKKAKSKI